MWIGCERDSTQWIDCQSDSTWTWMDSESSSTLMWIDCGSSSLLWVECRDGSRLAWTAWTNRPCRRVLGDSPASIAAEHQQRSLCRTLLGSWRKTTSGHLDGRATPFQCLCCFQTRVYFSTGLVVALSRPSQPVAQQNEYGDEEPWQADDGGCTRLTGRGRVIPNPSVGHSRPYEGQQQQDGPCHPGPTAPTPQQQTGITAASQDQQPPIPYRSTNAWSWDEMRPSRVIIFKFMRQSRPV